MEIEFTEPTLSNYIFIGVLIGILSFLGFGCCMEMKKCNNSVKFE